MPQSLAKIVYVALAIVLLFGSNWLVYYISPFFALIYPVARGFAGIAACIALPIFAYQLAVKEFDGTVRVAVCATVVWLVLTLMSPSVERDEKWIVTGVVRTEYDIEVATPRILRFSQHGAEVAAREIFEERQNWLSEWSKEYKISHDGRAPENPLVDVKIEYFSITPSLRWTHDLLGKYWAVESYTTSLRVIDDYEDPLGLIEPSYPQYSDDGRYERF